MAKVSPEVQAHLQWLGFVQPTGLVVSAPAMVNAGAVLPQNDRRGHKALQQLVEERTPVGDSSPRPVVGDFRELATQVLGWTWRAGGYAGTTEVPIPEDLHVAPKDQGAVLKPTYAVVERSPEDGALPWQLLVCEYGLGQELDKPIKTGHLEASPHVRLETLLRETKVPAGLLFNGITLRLMSRSSDGGTGWLDFQIAPMVETAGRPILAAMRLLLSEQRLLALRKEERLAALLAESRKYQNEVSERLAEQVLHALYELMRGLQAADDAQKGRLLQQAVSEDPDQVYRALLSVVLRLVFLLYAEEREMLPGDGVFARHYGVGALHRRLREDAALYPDTMDQRYGAWAQLLVLFRMIFEGAKTNNFELPSRHGELFDPQRYPFLEGRPQGGGYSTLERIEAPLVPDGTVLRALEQLLVLDGERISYRALDVEQIGSVYETMMGFRIEKADGVAVAIKAPAKHGAPTTISLNALLDQPAGKRAKWVTGKTGRKPTKTVLGPLKEAQSLNDLHAALDRIVDKGATPDLVARGALVLQPSEARRKSGSHYTPRELTQPIVQATLRPILDRLHEEAGGVPAPDAILDVKVCDPAMGSGAFLVEASRQLGAALQASWAAHGAKPEIPPDEDEAIHAMRLVAQRCLYGVDRNPVAVELAKVSLWLATLARSHAFTFLDHALRHGDSLVGLSNAQIAAQDWSKEEPPNTPRHKHLTAKLEEVFRKRQAIREADEGAWDGELRSLMRDATLLAEEIRTWGDLVIEAFFSAEKDRERREALSVATAGMTLERLEAERDRLDELRRAELPLAPFHWELEFPEVFGRREPGFDAVVGNPPFAGRSTVSRSSRRHYPAFLRCMYPTTRGKTDLVAFFFLRAFSHLRLSGRMLLIATNTIAQGDTRVSALQSIRASGGTIFFARRRVEWPGRAAVVVSQVGIAREGNRGFELDGKPVDAITPFLLPRGPVDEPPTLRANDGLAFLGVKPGCRAFLFGDAPGEIPDSRRQDFIESHPDEAKAIRTYAGGAELYADPILRPTRWILALGSLDEDDLSKLPNAASLLRSQLGDRPGRWWRYASPAKAMKECCANLDRVLVRAEVSSTFAFLFLDPLSVELSNKAVIFASSSTRFFSVLQSRLHEAWCLVFSSSMKDDLSYVPSDCFETFPFPMGWQTRPDLEAAGLAYYDYRAQLMIDTDLGLTKTYNRFHDPEERDVKIVHLRELHSAMDRAVLDAYGWSDISTDCAFFEVHPGEERTKHRYRWPDEVHDEVLARLLELNAERAEKERRAAQDDRDQGSLF